LVIAHWSLVIGLSFVHGRNQITVTIINKTVKQIIPPTLKLRWIKQKKMKTKTKSPSKRRRMEDLIRNAPAMSAKLKRKYEERYEEKFERIVMLLVLPRLIKAKLGFGINTRNGDFLLRSQTIFEAFTNDVGGFFAAVPFAMLALLGTQNTTLQQAMKNVKLGIAGAEGDKIAAKQAAKLTLDAALDYVNGLARLNQPNAVAIIDTAKMEVIGAKSLNKQDLTVQQATGSGEAILRVLAAKNELGKLIKAAYEWQYNITAGDNEAAYIYLHPTVVAKTLVTGMTTGIKIWFRKRVTTSKGTGAWSPPVSIILE
jgi:hypothetical protein